MTPTLIVTRPASQGAAFANAVKKRWHGPLEVVLSPLVEIKPCDVMTDLRGVKDVIFTSANGIAAAEKLNLPSKGTAWCVGAKTAARARDAGFTPVIGPGDAAGLVDLIVEHAPIGTLAHIRGRHARGNICPRLSDAGLTCLDVVAYDQTALPLNNAALNRLKGKGPIIFPLFSPRTAAILGNESPFGALIYYVVMSEAVGAAVSNVDTSVVEVATQPDENAMIEATVNVLQRLTQRRG